MSQRESLVRVVEQDEAGTTTSYTSNNKTLELVSSSTISRTRSGTKQQRSMETYMYDSTHGKDDDDDDDDVDCDQLRYDIILLVAAAVNLSVI